MDADLDTLCTALYVKIDDELKIRPELRRHRPEVGLCPKLSDAELISLCVVQALLGFSSETRFLRFAKEHLRHLFPYIPGQSGYNKRLRRAGEQLSAIIRLLTTETDCWLDDTWLVDSTPVEYGADADRRRFGPRRLRRLRPSAVTPASSGAFASISLRHLLGCR